MKKAFTLIEVLIALVLMSVVLFFVALAIETHLRIMDSSRTEVEETQLARALLEKISRDIRSVVVEREEVDLQVDASIFEALFQQSASMDSLDTSSLDDSSLTDLTDSLSSGTSTDTSEDTSVTSDTELPEEGTVMGTTPGIYGTNYWIQIDTGRLPRGETFKTDWVLAEGSSLGDRTSPTKTAFYYLGEDTGYLDAEEAREEYVTGSLGQPMGRFANSYGLYRRQLDRYVCEYAAENSLESKYEEFDEALAPEVEDIEFWYYDSENEEWVDYWDMDEFGALPGAVQVIISIRKKHVPRSALLGAINRSRDEVDTLVYSTIVPMPLSYVAPIAEEEEETTDTTSL